MSMQVNVINKKNNAKVEAYARDRLELVMGRFADRVSHVDVHVIDENGTKGGCDKTCTIDMKLIPRGQLHVRAKHDDLYSAIAKAIHRAETVVAKAVDKGHRGQEVRHKQGGIRHLPPDIPFDRPADYQL